MTWLLVEIVMNTPILISSVPRMNARETFEKISAGGFCIGCGACAAMSEAIGISMGKGAHYTAGCAGGTHAPQGAELQEALFVCPFSNAGPNEDELSESLFSDESTKHVGIGRSLSLYAGYVSEGRFRERGASGGVITWILTELLERGMVDAVLHVRGTDQRESGVLFEYAVSRTPEEVASGAKSHYYPVEISKIMDEVRRVPGRYVFVGLPCFVKAVRKLCIADEVIGSRVRYCVGLVCGHLKDRNYANCFAWQVGILPGELEEVDFRVKLEGNAPYDYGVRLRSGGRSTLKPVRELLGSNWGWNCFRYSACDYCDDVFAEVADVAVGDAWLPEYVKQPEGNSVVIVRHHDFAEMLRTALSEGRLKLDELPARLAAHSQAGGLRDRREGLAYRLHLKEQEGEWTPRKRVAPSIRLSRTRRSIYDCRLELRSLSQKAWDRAVAENDFNVFRDEMRPAVDRLASCYSPFMERLLLRVRHACIKLFRVE